MRSQYEWRSGAATGRMVLNEGVALLLLSGPLTASACASLKQFAETAAPSEVRAWVMDMRAALVTLAPDEMDAFFDDLPPGSSLIRPGAVVVQPELLGALYQHARSIAQRGVLRSAFTEMLPALQWARREAWLAA